MAAGGHAEALCLGLDGLVTGGGAEELSLGGGSFEGGLLGADKGGWG